MEQAMMGKKTMTINEGNNIYFIDKASVGKFSERQMKVIAEAIGLAFDKAEGRGYVSVYGGLGNGFWDSWMNYSQLTAAIELLLNNDEIKDITLLINSPGGMAQGLFDCCRYIESASKKKPINAYITGMACSAAYAIATACTKVYGIADGDTGCCGCYAEALEIKEETYEKWGLLHRIFRSANAPKKNVSIITDEEAGKEYQERISALGNEYLEYVASRRNVDLKTAEKTFGKGAVVSMEYALDNGMIDGICPLEDFIELTSSVPTDESEGEDMDITKMSAEEQKEVFNALCTANPSLITERMDAVRLEEKERLEALNSLRDGSEEVDAIIDSAVEEGKNADAVGLAVAKAMKANASKAHEQAKVAVLENLADETTPVATPSAEKSEAEVIDDLASRI